MRRPSDPLRNTKEWDYQRRVILHAIAGQMVGNLFKAYPAYDHTSTYDKSALDVVSKYRSGLSAARVSRYIDVADSSLSHLMLMMMPMVEARRCEPDSAGDAAVQFLDAVKQSIEMLDSANSTTVSTLESSIKTCSDAQSDLFAASNLAETLYKLEYHAPVLKAAKRRGRPPRRPRPETIALSAIGPDTLAILEKYRQSGTMPHAGISIDARIETEASRFEAVDADSFYHRKVRTAVKDLDYLGMQLRRDDFVALEWFIHAWLHQAVEFFDEGRADLASSIVRAVLWETVVGITKGNVGQWLSVHPECQGWIATQMNDAVALMLIVLGSADTDTVSETLRQMQRLTNKMSRRDSPLVSLEPIKVYTDCLPVSR